MESNIVSPTNLYMYGGFLLVFAYLLYNRLAHLRGNVQNGMRKCGDGREDKEFITFGGAAAFTFGLESLLVGLLLGLLRPMAARVNAEFVILAIQGFVFSYAWFQFWLSVVQSVLLLLSLFGKRGTAQPVLAHRERCGFTLAESMFWPVYFISHWVLEEPLVKFADGITALDYVFSKPGHLVVGGLAKLVFDVELLFGIHDVDHPHGGHTKPTWA